MSDGLVKQFACEKSVMNHYSPSRRHQQRAADLSGRTLRRRRVFWSSTTSDFQYCIVLLDQVDMVAPCCGWRIIIRQAGDTNSALRICQGEHYVSAACSDLPPLPIFSIVLYYSIRLTWWHLVVVGETAQASVCHVMVLRLVCLLKC